MQTEEETSVHGMQFKPCDRCGVIRGTDKRRRFNLCRDCRFVLSKEEAKAWEK